MSKAIRHQMLFSNLSVNKAAGLILLMVSVLQALLLGVLQGVTEWLPISSSGHLVLMQQFMRVDVPIFFNIFLHLGTLLAVLAVYARDVRMMVSAVFRLDFKCEHGRLFVFIVLASIPTAVIGLGFHDFFSSLFSSATAVGVALIATGIILFMTRGKSGVGELNEKNSVIVGVAQGLAIIPGVSRSGATISAGMLLGLNRDKVARFSLLLSIPAIIGASILEPLLSDAGSVATQPLIVGFLASAVVGYVSIKILLKVLSQGSFHKFAYYCWLVGGIAVATQLF